MEMTGWKDVAKEIETTTIGIWSEEPGDVRRLRLGIIPSRAGSFNQYFSTFVFALTYSLTLGEHVVYGLVKGADNDKVSLEALKELVREHFASGFEAPMFLGYVLAPQAGTFAANIVQALDSVTTREQFKRLLGSYLTYLNILHWWLHIYFPWSLGSAFEQVDVERVREMQRLIGAA
jgi:hypothetical protein